MARFPLTKTALLLAVTLVIQMGGFPQPITGPLVNTMLYIASLAVGITGGVLIGALTPIIAFFRGILAPPLAPAIPFIILGNATLVIIFGTLHRNRPLAILAASLLKYLVLGIAVRFIIEVPGPVAIALQTPQLITALAGGAIAWLLHRPLVNAGVIEEQDGLN
ncbi:MAG: ECF transporter S component [Limnochordia bacterium]|jgi:hypothetical protein